MLCYKATQVLACTKEEPKPWTFEGKTGTVFAAKLACLGAAGGVAEIKLKAKTEAELVAKIAKYSIGKAADVPVLEIVPIFKQGDRKASGYEYIG